MLLHVEIRALCQRHLANMMSCTAVMCIMNSPWANKSILFCPIVLIINIIMPLFLIQREGISQVWVEPYWNTLGGCHVNSIRFLSISDHLRCNLYQWTSTITYTSHSTQVSFKFLRCFLIAKLVLVIYHALAIIHIWGETCTKHNYTDIL